MPVTQDRRDPFPPSPLITVLMPVLNPHPRYFEEAIRSVLDQSFTNFELVIVEEPSHSSTSETLRSLADPRIRHIQRPARTSLVEQLNAGLEAARGAYIARLDADDIAEVDRLLIQHRYLDEHPEIDVVGSSIRIMDEGGNDQGRRNYPLNHDEIVNSMRRYNPMAHPSVMFRKRVVVDAGGWRNGRFSSAEDYELWSRLARGGSRFANLPELLIRYRVHSGAAKATKVKEAIRGTLAVKRVHWRNNSDFISGLVFWMERVLLFLPSPLVFKLFTLVRFTKA